MRRILVNAIKCKQCGEIIESTEQHQYVSCKCGACAVDGGHEYLRRSFQSPDCYFELSVMEASDEMSDRPPNKTTMRWRKVEKFLASHAFIMNADVRALCGVSAATANRILAGLSAEGKLVKYLEGRHWAYKLADPFYSESNTNYLRSVVEDIDSGKAILTDMI